MCIRDRLGILTKNRREGNNGVAYGGVAVVWREKLGSFRQVEIGAGSFEVLAVAGSIRGYSRKFVVVAVYIPPNYDRTRGAEAIGRVEDAVIELKRRYGDPYLIIAGDFNQWKVQEGLDNFADISEIKVGNTRGNKAIDRVFSNLSRSVEESGTLAPLETEEEGRQSDHRVAYAKIVLRKNRRFEWVSYSYRRYTDHAAAKFREWIVWHDWASVLTAAGSERKAEEYQSTVTGAVERFFPLRRVKKRSTDPPWMDKRTRDMIEARKKLYREEGKRTDAWKREKKRTDEAVRARKRLFFDCQKEHLLAEDANRNFYKHVRNFGKAERPKLFNVRDLMPQGQTDKETAELLANYFNRISNEFDPLSPEEVPCTCLLYTSPSPRDRQKYRMPSSA